MLKHWRYHSLVLSYHTVFSVISGTVHGTWCQSFPVHDSQVWKLIAIRLVSLATLTNRHVNALGTPLICLETIKSKSFYRKSCIAYANGSVKDCSISSELVLMPWTYRSLSSSYRSLARGQRQYWYNFNALLHIQHYNISHKLEQLQMT